MANGPPHRIRPPSGTPPVFSAGDSQAPRKDLIMGEIGLDGPPRRSGAKLCQLLPQESPLTPLGEQL